MAEHRNPLLLFEKYPDLEANNLWIKLVPLRAPVKNLTTLENSLDINSL